MASKKRAKGKSKARKPVIKMIKGAGGKRVRRCVQILPSGKWRFRNNSVCGLKTETTKTKTKGKRK